LNEGYCVTYGEGAPTSDYNAAIRAGYGYSLSQGQEFVTWLQQHSGWWSEYMSGGEVEMWKVLIALAYAYEMSGAWKNTTLHNLMSQAFANKLGWFVDTYGAAGYYIFLGSMGTIRNRVEMSRDGTIDDKPFLLNDAFAKTSGIWDGTLRSNNPNAPFDFANSMPEKQPAELLESVNDFATACTNFTNGCDTTGIAGTLYVLVSRNGDVWNLAFIVSYSQWMSWR
jgi:hypothetical protein